MKIFFRALPWAIILISILIPAFFYNALPDSILIARSFFGAENITAPKSLFTVFRVPLIETLCAAAVELMRRNSSVANAKLSPFWTILLYAVALKSLFQSLEIVSSAKAANVFFYLTVGVVTLGLIAAIVAGWNSFPRSWRTAWKFEPSEKLLLISLLLGYLGLAIVPVMVYK